MTSSADRPAMACVIFAWILYGGAGPVLAQSITEPASSIYLKPTFNAQFANGTQKQQSFEQSLAFARNWGPTTTRADTTAAYGSSQKPNQPKTVGSETVMVDLRQEVPLSPMVSVFGLAGYYHHITFGLRSQQSYGGGVAVKLPALPTFSVVGDLRYLERRFQTSDVLSSAAARIGQTYTYTHLVTPSGSTTPVVRFIVTESFELVSMFDDVRGNWARSTVAVSVPLVKGFQLETGIGHEYMADLPAGFETTFWKLKSGISYEFTK
jgi:hypothetical protein